jgi:uncharacterized membrane protein
MDLKTILLEVMYIACGLMSIYVGVKALREKDRANQIFTAIFWFALGILLSVGKYLPSV